MVAVVSGLVWWLVRADNGVAGQAVTAASTDDPLTDGEFPYTVLAGPETDTDCAANAYGRAAEWFSDHPCGRVARGLYTTQVGQARALVSVVLVTMPTPDEARQLKELTDTDGTGNVSDLIRDGTVSLPDAPTVARGKYHSRLDGNEVTIVEAAFFGDHDDDATLARISADAVRLSAQLRG